MKIKFINKFTKQGVLKSDKNLENELEELLNLYRRNDIVLNDKLFNYEKNLIPVKDETIDKLKQHIEKLQTEIKDLKLKKWW